MDSNKNIEGTTALIGGDTHPRDDVRDEAASEMILVHQDERASHVSLHSYDDEPYYNNHVHSISVGFFDGDCLAVKGVKTPLAEYMYKAPVTACEIYSLTSKDSINERKQWSNKVQFLLACIGYAVGMGNIWRFPYLCYKSGGGAFLFPYFIMLFVCGIPLLLLELAVGQFTRQGPIGALKKLCPIFTGAGIATVILSFLLSTYYNIVIAWTLYYLFYSFNSVLPWKSCNNTWNTPNCTGNNASSEMDGAAQEFFNRKVLNISSGLEDFGELRLDLMIAFVVAWVLVYFAIWKGVKSSGKVVYFTAVLPYVFIFAFLIKTVQLPGSSDGLQYFFKPNWELLLHADVWVNAAAQNFNSLGIGFGSLIAFASFNSYHNDLVKDALLISAVNMATSLLTGCIVFSTLGNLAYEQQVPLDKIVTDGPGLVFIVYPQALAKMPMPSLWSVLFFFMIICLGLDSQFAMVEVVVTSLRDSYGSWIKHRLKCHEILVLLVCLVSLIFGLPNLFQGGIYYFHLIDHYAAAVSLMYLAFFEVIAVSWFYGASVLAMDIKVMTGKKISRYFKFCWWFASPVLIAAIWAFSIIDYKRPTYGKYTYPDWSEALGWFVASLSILPIPIFALLTVSRAEGNTLWEKLKASVRPQIRSSLSQYDSVDLYPLNEVYPQIVKTEVK